MARGAKALSDLGVLRGAGGQSGFRAGGAGPRRRHSRIGLRRARRRRLMRRWRTLADARTALYSPIALRLIDEITGRVPVGWVRPWLDASDGSGGWRETNINAVISPAGVVTYPALERRAEVLGQLPRRYRVRIEAQFYLPLFRAAQDAVEF